MRSAPTASGETPAGSAPDTGLTAATPPLTGLQPLEAPGTMDTSALATGAPDGQQAGDDLPETGNDLPPGDVTSLLASLAAPPLAAGPPPMPPAQAGEAPPATPDAAAGAIATAAVPAPAKPPASAMKPPPPDVASASVATAADAADPARWAAATDEPAPDTAKGAADPALPDSGASTSRERGMELALPAEFRARLDALLNATQRPAFAADGGTLAVSGMTAHAGAALQSTTAAGPATDPFDALPVLQPHGNPDAWTQGLGDRLLLMAEKGLQSATIRLQPEQLGPMEIRIRVDDDGSAQVLFSAHHAQTRDALETAIPRLRDMLADQGLSLSQAGVDSGRGSFAQKGSAGGDAVTWDRWATDEPEAPAPKDVSVWRLARGTERRLDVFV